VRNGIARCIDYAGRMPWTADGALNEKARHAVQRESTDGWKGKRVRGGVFVQKDWAAERGE
jgi:hypothetical protein